MGKVSLDTLNSLLKRQNVLGTEVSQAVSSCPSRKGLSEKGMTLGIRVF